MRLAFRLLALLLLLAVPGFSQSQYYLYGNVAVLPRQINTVNLIHVNFDSSIRKGDTIEKGQRIGTTSLTPKVRSARYGLQILDSEAAYKKGDYATAAAVLEDAAQQEADNPFISYQLARALYKMDASKPRAYTLYQRLITQLDKAGETNDSTLNVDVWFAEAYWKLGTLYMDNAQWPEAILSISQGIIAAPKEDLANTPLQEEMLAYLTECFYHIGDRAMCQHYGQLTLKLFPQNQYVKPYLAQLRRTAPPQAQKKPARKASGGLQKKR
ncbi:hypothetical protein LGH70_01415 [Hymenobacter sp. BT635]|uniref:Tetratricopeptide repeat protein n=1 Tax=Hymenobacter nitidus TaxID=2880929 RepID=A0ABS8A8K4_9BACT|nr:hypothetical protein [Hymenobacter nitidus]MCB2376221.1 hypothetical protein [Hymenobacter nitidus]